MHVCTARAGRCSGAVADSGGAVDGDFTHVPLLVSPVRGNVIEQLEQKHRERVAHAQLTACLTSFSCLRFPFLAHLPWKPLSFYLHRTQRPPWINGEVVTRLPGVEPLAAGGETRCVRGRGLGFQQNVIVRGCTSRLVCYNTRLEKLVEASQNSFKCKL